MDCCQLEQDIIPTVKREVLEDNDRKSPDQDSSGKKSSKKDGVQKSKPIILQLYARTMMHSIGLKQKCNV